MRRLTLLLLVLALPAPASAQAAREELERYRAIATQGQDAFNRHDFAEARRLWLSARDILPNPRVYRLLGRAADALNDPAEAVRMFRLALSAPDNGNALSPRLREEVEHELLPAAQARVGELSVELSPADAQILVDGRPATLEEGSLVIAAGRHTLRVERAGYATREEQIEVRAGAREPLRIELSRAETTQGEGPPSAPASSEPQLIGPLVLLGVGAAGLIVFAVAGGVTMAENDRLASACGSAAGRTCMPEQLSDLHTFAAVADVGLTVGILAAAAGAAWLLYELLAPRGASESARIAPWAQPDAFGVVLFSRMGR